METWKISRSLGVLSYNPWQNNNNLLLEPVKNTRITLKLGVSTLLLVGYRNLFLGILFSKERVYSN